MTRARTLALAIDAGDEYPKGARVEVLAMGEELRPGAVDAGRAETWIAAGIATEERSAPPPPAPIESGIPPPQSVPVAAGMTEMPPPPDPLISLKRGKE